MIYKSLNSLPEDRILVERLQKGDLRAFDMLYYKYVKKLLSFSYRHLRSKEDSEELIQSVFLKIWENRENLKKETSFQSYVFTITYNDICKNFRKRYYHQRFIQYTIEENIHSTNNAADIVEHNSLYDQIRIIVNNLPEKQKTIFMKSRVDGKSSKEIAEELGLSIGTVDNYISISLKLIRSRLLKEDIL